MRSTNKVIRIYTPFTADLCIATPHAKVNGKLSYLPLAEGSSEIELITDVEAAGGIVDPNYSLISSQKGHSEEGQIELTLLIPDVAENPNKALVRLGVDSESLPIFKVDTAQHDKLVVSGTFDEDTLRVFAKLARSGSSLRINGIHFDADDDKHFTGRMTERQFSHDGTSAGDHNIWYPTSDSKDEQTTIRKVQDLDIYLDGFGFLEIPLYKGVEVRMLIKTTYIK
ncbi:hypothetical protein [Aureispira sp. CCB-E]|uniref:hypothetical protein n=1 Tax=Aureispira sp. CCB-E TaxID=3051121 RepID=UPI002868FE27|nr:hypothetical protein [Aureispira sp. CCB-E]WMX15286.1 hypothetical protein QP953_02735 [Aureispira sp. CCB-E]